MKKNIKTLIILLFFSLILSSCGKSVDNPCDCINNELNEGEPGYDKEFAKECEEHKSNMSYNEYLNYLDDDCVIDY